MKERTHQSAQTLFALLIAFLFSITTLLLVLMGVEAYRNVSRSLDANNQIRASLSYVANKIRSAERADDISLQLLDGHSVLVIRSAQDQALLKTYLYDRDGYLMEIFADEADPFEPERGEKITAVSAFSVEEKDGLFQISATTPDNRQISVSVCPRAS